MKKIAILLDNATNHATYARISGLFQTIYRENRDVALYMFRSRGSNKLDERYNLGEYNIFRLPDLKVFDGFVLVFYSLSGEHGDFCGRRVCREMVERIRESGKPVVTLGERIEGIPHIGIDNYSSMAAIMRHLMQLHQCRDFWFFMGAREHRETRERAEAIRQYLAGWDNKDYSDYFYYESYQAPCGEHGFRQFRAKYGTLPDAIVCANDMIAIGALMEAEKEGFHCPQDFLVTGFDGADVASCYTPTLTTIDQNWEELGRVCLDYFDAKWAGEDFPENTTVYTQMMRRQSCGCDTEMPEEAGSLFNERIRQSMELEGFNNRLNRLEYELMNCTTLPQIGDVFLQMIPYLQFGRMYLVLDRRFYSEREQAGLLHESIHRRESMGELFMTEGYPPEMVLGFACEDGQITAAGKSVKYMYSEYIKLPAPKDCMFLPVHFGERSVGYLVLTDVRHLLHNAYLARAIQTLLGAIENFYIRSRLKSANSMLSRFSITDAMTGFYNRMGYQEVAFPWFKKRHDEGVNVAILFADMDGMKRFNDVYGHECGDQAIIAVSQAIRRGCPRDAVIARMGGDEFLVLVEETDRTRVEELISRIKTEVPRTEAAGHLPYAPAVSIGYVISDAGSDTGLDEYVRLSDERMYMAKRESRERREN